MTLVSRLGIKLEGINLGSLSNSALKLYNSSSSIISNMDAIPLKKVEKSTQLIYAIGLVLQQRKYFKGLHIHFSGKYFNSNTYIRLCNSQFS